MLKPLFDNVLVKRKEEEKMQGLLHIPSTAQKASMEAEVIACGNGRMLDNGTTAPMSVKPGDIVLIPRTGMDLKFENEDFVMIQEFQILAIVS